MAEKRIVQVSNMENEQDANMVLKALLDVWGVEQAEVNLNKGEAMFSFNERMASSIDFEQAIIDSGFHVTSKGTL